MHAFPSTHIAVHTNCALAAFGPKRTSPAVVSSAITAHSLAVSTRPIIAMAMFERCLYVCKSSLELLVVFRRKPSRVFKEKYKMGA